MRVLLISLNAAVTPYPVFPLGAAVVLKALRRAGHEAHMLDLLSRRPGGARISQAPGAPLSAEERALVREEIAALRPECVGISVRNLESVDSFNFQETWALNRVRSLVELLREQGAVPIVIGGPGFSLLPENVLAYTGADVGVVGQGEEVFVEALAGLAEGRPLPRLLRGANGPIGGAEYGDLALAYDGLGGVVGVQSRRGCGYGCAYCCYPNLEGRVVRARPSAEVVAEIRHLHDDLGLTEFSFADAAFNDPGGLWRELAEELAKARLPMRWTAFLQPARLDAADMDLLRRSGAKALEFGTDAASDATLRGLAKPFSMKEVLRVQQYCTEAGLAAAHYVIFGGPGETADTVEEGLAHLESMQNAVVIACSGISLHPDTPLWRRAVAEGVLSPDDDLLHPRYYFAPGLDREAMEARIQDAFHRRRDRIFPPSAMDERLMTMHRMGVRGARWETLITRRKKAG